MFVRIAVKVMTLQCEEVRNELHLDVNMSRLGKDQYIIQFVKKL